MKKVGYARVSTQDQKLDLQIDALKREGCKPIFKEKMTGKRGSRPELDKALARLQKGDEFIVWKLDRLGRSLKHLASVLYDLQARGVKFRSISDGIDTSTPGGKLLFGLIATFAEFECNQISERTIAGLCAARRRGAILGRPCKLKGEKLRLAKRLRREKASFSEIALCVGEPRTTVWRALKNA